MKELTIQTTPIEPKWVYDLKEDDYHADRTAVGSSLLRKILESPKKFHHAFTKEEPSVDTDALRFGRLAHKAILEGSDFLKSFVVQPDFGDMRSSKNRAAKEDWLATLKEGAQVVTEEELKNITGMAESILAHPDACRVISGSISEASGYFSDPETGIKCRIRPDILAMDATILGDLKTTRDSSESAFVNSLWNYGYDFQLAFYRLGIQTITGKKPEFECFIAVEKEEPWECAVYILDPTIIESGEYKVRKALRLLKDCLTSNEFPRANKTAVTIGLKPWQLNQVELGYV